MGISLPAFGSGHIIVILYHLYSSVVVFSSKAFAHNNLIDSEDFTASNNDINGMSLMLENK